jgi:hypothetical protein
MAINAKVVIVNFYILIRASKNVLYVQSAKTGIVRRSIHILGLDLVLIKKTVQIWLVCVYIHQNARNCSVRLELSVGIFRVNSTIHLNDHQYVINQIDVQTLTALAFMDQTGIRAKQKMSVKTNIVLKFIHPSVI